MNSLEFPAPVLEAVSGKGSDCPLGSLWALLRVPFAVDFGGGVTWDVGSDARSSLQPSPGVQMALCLHLQPDLQVWVQIMTRDKQGCSLLSQVAPDTS